MGKYKITDEKIRLGYEYAIRNKSVEACDTWLDAWEDIKGILSAENLKDLDALDKKYSWCEFMSNFIQDLEMELDNAGQAQEEYFKKRIKYCEEMLEVLSEEHKLTIENTKRAIAETYYALGDKEKCDSLFTGWLDEDPHWGWGYIGWADCYGFRTNKIKPDQTRAEENIRIALEKKDVREREDVLMRGAEIYEESGQIEKAKELEREMKRLRRQANTLIKPVKVGRNDLCPCGSRKKYKKCCGQN